MYSWKYQLNMSHFNIFYYFLNVLNFQGISHACTWRALAECWLSIGGVRGVYVSHLSKTFELISSVPECSYSVHVEWVLPLADCSNSVLLLRHFGLLVCFATVIWNNHINQGKHTYWGPDRTQYYKLTSQSFLFKLVLLLVSGFMECTHESAKP